MPKNKKGGKKAKKGKNKGAITMEKRTLEFKSDGQEYGVVLRILGGPHVEVKCMDEKVRTCTIRGTMRRKQWMKQGDLVLVSLRDFQDEKGDIVWRYTLEESRHLKGLGEIPDDLMIEEAEESDDPFEYEVDDL